MKSGLLRRIMAVISVALYALGGAFSAIAASTLLPHQHAEVALHHDLTGHHHHDGYSSGDVAATADRAPDGGGMCDHPHHACCHAHACCTAALTPADVRQPQPPSAGLRLSQSFDVLPAGRITHPLLRPPRTAA